ncbi:HAD family hydrolase [Nocardioides sp.]|uniref:HAD family hydrolase n=1 Tax=Nocardioides sp. TaxID=35761 RepID=UPI002ED07817
MSAPRLVATDLDGTLVRDDGSVSATTRAVLAALDEREVPVVIVTARPIRWMDDLWPIVGRHGLAIVSNGAAVVEVREDAAHTVRDVRGIEVEAGLALVDAIREAAPEAAFAVECVSGLVRDPAYVETESFPAGSPVGDLGELWAEPALKLLVKHDAPDPDDFRRRVAEAVGEQAVATWTVDGLVEISATGVTKATALARVAEELGVAPEDAVAFGDMPNDLPMLTWAGTSYAMANGHPDVREAADHVAPANDDDGVAQVLAGLFNL